MEKVLSKKAFPQWVKKLESYTIYSPRKDGDFWNFEVIKNSEIIDLDYLNTVLSPLIGEDEVTSSFISKQWHVGQR
ncbi:unnamed protein product [marine sediment metagenome]|uniref:Uncharacterized protein n=1 Tax=marine sediment metagenome TaxID=412755 RepID=X1MR98_9ZZZZ